MAKWPRVSMGRPFLEKFADVQWEVNEDHLQSWKDGKTGYPIVDAAMRACNTRGGSSLVYIR
jgi:deoxyribodipyrimidine photo-lyase